MNLYWAAGGSFVFFVLVGIFGGKMLHLQGSQFWFFFGLMTVLGLASAALFVYFQRKKSAGGMAGSGAGDSETDALIRDANARLAQSKAAAGIANLPMIFVIGDRGTAKTSTILNSGVEPELLAGQVYQENVVAPTRNANVFYARNTVFVEAGGALMGDPQAWSRLVARLQPGRLKSLASGGHAPRGVLLCFDLETFTRQGASEAIANAARYLQARLGEISQTLGISFPVYVLFTRADRLPFFADFVRNLSNEEAGQVMGATLPISQASGVYGEQETQRLTAAFHQLFHTFCDSRLRLLPRETDASKLPTAYEFPREFRKLRNSLVQFLVDVGRPSQLRASPFLRGFYFSGVRPVQVSDAPQVPVAAAPQQAELSGATGMFRAGLEAQKRAQQVQPAASSAGGSRRVPQWLFLGHLFNDVILADEAGRAASGSSTKTSMLKRVLFASAAALCLLYTILATVSFFHNKALEDKAQVAAQALSGTAATNAIPSDEALRKLEAFRQPLAELTDYEYNGAPLSMRWGLYSGSSILPSVRRAYYTRFSQLLFGGTQAGLAAYLQRVPTTPAPADDYGFGYDSLKAYLLTTAEWKRSADPGLQAFLGQKLHQRWSGGHESEIGQPRLDLARKQFEFYAQDLPHGNPYAPDSDGGTVERSRSYLSKFSGFQRVYQFLLSEAAKKNPPQSFNQKFPGSGDAVTSNEPVAWAFTKDGWKFMQDQIKKQNFGGEQWVLGAFQSQGVDRAAMEKGILDAYTHDYIEQWRTVLRRSNVNRYAGYQDASRKLTILTGSGAPLLALLWWTSQNTGIDLPGVAEKFKAVQTVVPPSTNQQYIVAPNQNYNGALLNLQQSVDRAANKDPNGEQAVRDGGQSAKLSARQLSASFPPDTEGHVDQRTEELLLQPITYLDGLVGGDLRAGGAGFCSAFNTMTSKFPFNPAATPEVTLEELGAFLRPNTGRLWTFYETTLKSVMQCQNGECAQQGSAPINPNFLRFVGQLMKFSRALYGEAGQEPNLRYSLRPQMSDQVSDFGVTVNGEAAQLKGGNAKPFTWPGPGTPAFKLALKTADGGNLEVQSWSGTWAVFRFFADANRSPGAGNGGVFSWTLTSGRSQQPVIIKGRPLTYEFAVDMGVFSKEFLSTLRCGAVTR